MRGAMYLFREISNDKTFTKRRRIVIKRIWTLRILFVFSFFLILGLGAFYGVRGDTLGILIGTFIFWLFPIWYEIVVFGTEIKDYTTINISETVLIIEKLSRFSWKLQKINIPIKTIRKIIIDGKSDRFIIQLSDDTQIIIKKSRGYLQTYFFMGRKLEELTNALKVLQIEYEVIYK